MPNSNDMNNPVETNENELTGQYSPVSSFTQRVDILSKENKLEYPKYRTLSEEQTRTYIKATKLPDVQRKSMALDLAKGKEQDAAKNAKNAVIVEMASMMSGVGTEAALGNILVTDDYSPVASSAVEAYAGGKIAQAVGGGALRQAGAFALGTAAMGGLLTALSPTELGGEDTPQEIFDSFYRPKFESLEKDWKSGKISYDEYTQQTKDLNNQFETTVKSRFPNTNFQEQIEQSLKSQGYTDEQIERLKQPTKVQSLGLRLTQSAMDRLEYRTSVMPQVDADSVAARFATAPMSAGEYLMTGVGVAKLARTAIKASKMPTDRFGRKAAEFTAQKGTKYEDVVDRYAGMVGNKIGSGAATAQMSSDIMGQGALESIQKYIEDTGDTELTNYTGDIRKAALDAFSTHTQNVVEKMGFNKFIKNPRAVKKWGEWGNGLVQEFTQGEINDVSEFVKGNQSAMDVINNIPYNVIDGVAGSWTQGTIGTAYFNYYHNKNVNDLVDVIMAQKPNKTEQEVRQFAENKVKDIENEVSVDVVKEIVDFTDATQYQGKIYENIRDNVKKAIDYQMDIMKDTDEGSEFENLTEDELAQYVEQVAHDETDKVVIESLEQGTPLSESPRLKGITIAGTYYLEGEDYAQETKRQAEATRQALLNAVYAEREAQRAQRLADQMAEGAERARERRIRAESAQQTKEAEQRVKLDEKSAKEIAKQVEKSLKEQVKSTNNIKIATTKAIKSGNVETIGKVLSDNGFAVRNMSGTQIKLLAKLNWQLFKGMDLGESMRSSDKRVALSAIEKNVESGNAVLTRAGYTKEQIDSMDDETWNRAVLTQYRKENQEQEPELTEEQLNAIPDDLQFQDLADENESLDAIYPEYTGETVEVDGKERTVYNSNGDRIAKSKEALTNFWRWFGDSKVVDEQGRPLVVYHGTNAEFDTFDKTKIGSALKKDTIGFFFITDKNVAKTYDKRYVRKPFYRLTEEEKANNDSIEPMSLYLKISNPITVNDVYQESGFDSTYYTSPIDMFDANRSVYNDYAEKHSDKDGIKLYAEGQTMFVAFEPNQIKSVDNRGTYSSDTGDIYYQSAYAGSRVDYDKPSLEAIGSGEGNQAHGWGLYYALNLDVAEEYRKVLTGGDYDIFVGNKPLPNTIKRNVSGGIMYDAYHNGNIEKLKENIKEVIEYLQTPNKWASDIIRVGNDLISVIDKSPKMSISALTKYIVETYPDEAYRWKNVIKAAVPTGSRTNIQDVKGAIKNHIYPFEQQEKEREKSVKEALQYIGDDFSNISVKESVGQVHEVDIPEMDVLLDEQEMLIDQSQFVQDIIYKINDEIGLNIKDSGIRGGEIYQRLENKLGSDKEASELLDKYGIKGITYDGRRDGRCFVIFNPESVKVLRKKFDEIGNVLFQNRQSRKGGAYDPRTRSITLGSGANVTTFPHEFAHYWIEKNFKWARSGKASQEWMRQWSAVEKWLGIDPDDKYLDKAASEKFARAYERFLGEEQVPLVLKKSLGDFRDFVLDHYDFELDEAKGLTDKFGRPIKLNDDVKNWFKKSIYETYSGPVESEVVVERLRKDTEDNKEIKQADQENETIRENVKNSESFKTADAETNLMEVQESAGISNEQIIGKREIGGGEQKESKGKIAQELGGRTYEATSWEIQEQMVEDYLKTVSLDQALEDLDNETYPEKIDPNFLRSALTEKLLDAGREMEATALIEETADDFSDAAQRLQAARTLNTPFTNAIQTLNIAKAEQLARAKFGNKKTAVADLDAAMNRLVAKYEKDFLNAETDEEREMVYAALQDEAVRTIGSLNKDESSKLDFQTIEDKEERKQAREIRKQQKRRASIKAYRGKAKRALKQALGLEPTRQQVREIRKRAVKVQKAIADFRKDVRQNKTSAIDPIKVLEAQNELNNYMNSQLPTRYLGTFADAANSYMMANMLWNPATNVFNLESTWVQMIPHLTALAINNGTFGTISAREKAKIIKSAIITQIKTGYNIFSLRDFFDNKTIWAEKFYEAQSVLGKGIRVPLTALGLTDTMNKGVVFLQAVDSIATKQAREEGKKNGWTAEQVKKRAKELFYQALNTDPRTITIDGLKIRKAAVQEGEEATFTQNTRTAQIVNKVRKFLNFGGKTGLGNVIMPFTTTIANIAEDTVANYTLGLVKNTPKAVKAVATSFDKTATAEMKKEAWKEVLPETKNAIKNVIGILILLSFALGGDDDDYVLGYDRQTAKDKDIRTNRNAPYGYAVRLGNKWVDLDLFGIGSQPAKMYMIARRGGFTADAWAKAVVSNVDLLPGVSELESMYDTFTNMSKMKGEWEGVAELASDKIEELSVRLIPASAFFGQIASIADTSKRETWNNWYDKMKAKIPGFRETLPERTSTQTGEVIPQTDTVFNLATGSRIKDYIEPTGADEVRYEFADSGKPLSYREGNSKLKELGKDTVAYKKAVNRVRKDFTKKLENISDNLEYQRLDIDQKRKVVNELHKEALTDVKVDLGLEKPKKASKKRLKKQGKNDNLK